MIRFAKYTLAIFILVALFLNQSCFARNKHNHEEKITEEEKLAIAEVLDGMIYVPSGTITVKQNENPVKVDLRDTVFSSSGFWLGRTEVTQRVWTAIMKYNNSHHQGDDYPVENVSWFECQCFISRLRKLTGIEFRLPQIEEWKYAAYAGDTNSLFAGSDSINEVGWYRKNSNDETHPVAKKRPNKLGFYDMTGNVSELCEDHSYYNTHKSLAKNLITETELCYHDTIIKEGVEGKSYQKLKDINKILRISKLAVGGSYIDFLEDCTLYNNLYSCVWEEKGNWELGLRLAFSLRKIYKSETSATYDYKQKQHER